MKYSFTAFALLFAGLIYLADPLAAQEVIWEQTILPTYGSIWSIPVYDGSNLVVSCETPQVGLKLAKFDFALNQIGSPVQVAGTNDTFGNDTISDHKHIFQNGCHYLTFSVSGADYLYLVKLAPDLTRIAITTVATNDLPTNDMLIVGDGTNVCVGKYLPGTGHRIYKYDADLNLLMTTNIGGLSDNLHANGAAVTYYNGSYYLVAPDTLAPGQNYRYSRLIFDSDWRCISNKTTILTNSLPTLWIVSGLSREPISGSFIMHYGLATNEGAGIYMAIYDSGWNLLTNTLVFDGQFARPHSVIVSNKLFLGYDGSAAYLSRFSISNAFPIHIGPTIKANGTRTYVTVNPGAAITITVEMNASIHLGVPVDWWVVAGVNLSGWYDWYYLNRNSVPQWTQFSGALVFLQPVYQGPLFNLPSTPVLSGIALPGTYFFWFAVDYPMDGVLDLSGQYNLIDFLTVIVQ